MNIFIIVDSHYCETHFLFQIIFVESFVSFIIEEAPDTISNTMPATAIKLVVEPQNILKTTSSITAKHACTDKCERNSVNRQYNAASEKIQNSLVMASNDLCSFYQIQPLHLNDFPCYLLDA